MLKREEFERQIKKFQSEFKSNYGLVRENLLYSAVNKATPTQLANAMLEALLRYNYDDLPTCKNLTGILYLMFPETAKNDKLFKFKLKSIQNDQRAV